MNALELKLCDIQGRLFELSVDRQLGSVSFIRIFMNSETAKALDSSYNRMQWAGEEYLLEEVVEAAGDKLREKGKVYPKDVIYWIGYIYRYWHYYTEEASKAIYKQAPAETMRRNYLMFHTMALEVAIEDLKEIYLQKHK
ncbi:MAG: hypothetical protein LUE24_14185 [Lachnospiraceae bacterium]|nr:hypothetical protein [Lachnospiraceae bacterium]